MRSAAQHFLLWIVCWFFWSVLAACTFDPPASLKLPLPPEGTPFSPIEKLYHGENKEFEEPGGMVVYYGRDCAVSDEKITDSHDTQKYLRVTGSHPLEERLDRATVFLNGWRFQYLDEKDQPVDGLGTAIFNIQRDDDGLHWEAWGAIGDRDFDNPYRWCYYYTVLAWSSAVYAANVDHRDVHAFLGDSHSDTALSYNAYYTVAFGSQPGPAGYFMAPNSAILPRGFGFVSEEGHQHLLQLAYNLDYSEQFIASGKPYGQDIPNLDTDLAAAYVRSWETKSILKGDALTRDYVTGEVVSVISSLRGGVVQPPFTILLNQDRSGCICAGYPNNETRTIAGLPFDVAIPILTGWDLQYCCDDQDVEEIGVRIQGFRYNASKGVLTYNLRSELYDHERDDSNVFRHRVSVLGFDRVSAAPPKDTDTLRDRATTSIGPKLGPHIR